MEQRHVLDRKNVLKSARNSTLDKNIKDKRIEIHIRIAIARIRGYGINKYSRLQKTCYSI